jgi:transcriptional regulator with XRE-family HTH domain
MFLMEQQKIANRIRKLRREAGLTLTGAAEKADLNKATLSKIETGQISPPIATLLRIAKVLRVSITDFFVDDEPQPVYVLTRKNHGSLVSQEGSKLGYNYEALALEKLGKAVEPFLLTIAPTDPPGKFHHLGQEFIYMLSGRMEFTIDDEPLVLRPGDSLYFDSNHVHKTRILGKLPAKFICVFIQGT